MARFVYRMQSVLNLKLHQEDQAKMAFGQAQRALNDEEEKLEGLKKRKQRYDEEGIRLRTASILDVQGISENRRASESMDSIIADQMEVVEEHRLILERARLRLTQSIQERRMQERLRERAYEEYLELERQEEQKETDERTSFTYGALSRSQR